MVDKRTLMSDTLFAPIVVRVPRGSKVGSVGQQLLEYAALKQNVLSAWMRQDRGGLSA